MAVVGGAELEVLDSGSGEPVVFVQTALTADEMLPVATDPALGGYRRIVYHRRGYAGSSPASGPTSMREEAGDCVDLMTALAVERVHLVGASFAAAIALQAAVEAPHRVHTLVLMEPPPLFTPSADEFRAANDALLVARDRLGAVAAVDELLTMLMGRDWRSQLDAVLPGGAAQTERDADTFFDRDVPALLSWSFGSGDAGRIACPVLHVGGSRSGPWFAQARHAVRSWFPGMDDVVIEGADHSLTLTHAGEVAAAVAEFLRRHPMR